MQSVRNETEEAEDTRLRALADSLPDPLLVVSGERIRFANRRAAELIGNTEPAALLERSIGDLVPVADRANLRRYIESANSVSVASFDTKLRRDDDRWVDVAVRAAPFEYQRQPAIQIVLRDITERKRAEAERFELLEQVRALYAAQQEDAAVSAALARVGRELLPELNTPAILKRLCQLTTELLECDNSQTIMEDEQDVFSIISAYGHSAEEWEALRLLRVPREVMAPLLELFAQQDLLQIPTTPLPVDAPDHHPAHRLPQEYGITHTMYVRLERGDGRFAYQTARRQGSAQPFSAAQERLFRGLAQLGCLALQNAQLVERLARADQFKADFLATMSHELRTPLGVIIGYNDLLMDGTFGAPNAEQAETLARIGTNARQLYDMVNATLDMSRIDAQPIPLDVHEVDLVALLKEIAMEFLARPAKPDVRLRFHEHSGTASLATDRSKLKIILVNLLNNALKFTDRGMVEIRVEAQPERIEVSVSDTGCGMPADALESIFEPFHQLRTDSAGRSGVGLGLYIVKRLTAALGGSIDVSSSLGVGCGIL